MPNIPHNLIYLILLIGFIISFFLQIYLSKTTSKISGIILPAIYFLRSLQPIFELWGYEISNREVFSIVLLQNIPTIILIVIYILGRNRIKRYMEIEKMNIQDLK